MVGTIYPLGIDGNAQLPLVIDNVSPVRAGDVNRIRDAIIAAEKELGINPSGTYATVRARLDALEALGGIGVGGEGAVSVLIDYLSVGLEVPSDKTYNLVTQMPYDGYIFSVSSKSSSGTCTAQVEIQGVALGGGANSVSTTVDTVFHSTSRDFIENDDLTLTISSNASALDVVITIVYVRFVTVSAATIDLDGYAQTVTVPVTNNSLVRYDGTSGNRIKDSVAILNSAGIMSDLVGLGVNLSSPTSTFHVSGSMAAGIATVSSGPTTLNATHSYVLADATGGDFQINLPTASTCSGRIYNIKKIDATAGVVTIARSGSDTIDGVTSLTLTIQYESLTFTSNGTNWFIF